MLSVKPESPKDSMLSVKPESPKDSMFFENRIATEWVCTKAAAAIQTTY